MGDYVSDITPHAKIQNDRPNGTRLKYHSWVVFSFLFL